MDAPRVDYWQAGWMAGLWANMLAGWMFLRAYTSRLRLAWPRMTSSGTGRQRQKTVNISACARQQGSAQQRVERLSNTSMLVKGTQCLQ
jgi:hypothetical protein